MKKFRSYIGRSLKLLSTFGEQSASKIMEIADIPDIPIIPDDDEDDNEEISSHVLIQCGCCKRQVEIIKDKSDNIISIRCPDCKPDINAS